MSLVIDIRGDLVIRCDPIRDDDSYLIISDPIFKSNGTGTLDFFVVQIGIR